MAGFRGAPMSSQPPPTPYPHWMLAEVYEQPEALRRTLHHYADGDTLRAESTEPLRAWLKAQTQLLIAASGSSRHAGLVGEVLLEELSSLPVDVEYASEYSYRTPQTASPAGVVVISQSGETGDTLLALRSALKAGQPTLAITNVPSSTMMREADVAMPTLAGVERAIPATKSFTAQLLALELLTLIAAQVHGTMPADALKQRLADLWTLPERIAEQLSAWDTAARVFAEQVSSANSFLFCGRGVHYPIAREGALKLKESAYVHAEAYPAGELRHGPTALVSAESPLVFLATVDRSDAGSVRRYDSVLQLMRELREKNAPIFVIANEGDANAADLGSASASIQPVTEPLAAICEVIPLQLLAYHFAIRRGVDVDRPRNLVKSVQAL